MRVLEGVVLTTHHRFNGLSELSVIEIIEVMMRQNEWEEIVKKSASGHLSKEEMQVAIAKADHILQFVRNQVRYGRSMQNWQRTALDNINQRLE